MADGYGQHKYVNFNAKTNLIPNNRFTYEISPVFILMEKEVIRKMMDLIGWGQDEGDAIFTPGIHCAWHVTFQT